MSYGLFSFLAVRPLSDLSRSRPRSGLLSVFENLTGASGLKRGNSTTSRGSSTATTTVDTLRLSTSASPRFTDLTSPQTSLSQSWRGPISKKSAPDLHASQARRSTDSLSTALRASESDAYDGLAELGGGPPVQRESALLVTKCSAHALTVLLTALSTRSRNRPRRSISLPPPVSMEPDSTTPTPSSPATPAAARDVAEDDAAMDATTDPAMFESPYRPVRELEAPDTSPMAYRAPVRSSSRRRMIGPRDMRAPTPVHNSEGSSPAHLPFAREQSPAPLRQPHATTQPVIAYQSSPSNAELGDVSFESQGSSTSLIAKRPRPPVEASPRPTPAKKVASLTGSSAGPRAPPPLQPDLFGSARKSSAGSLLQQRRVPSGSSVLNRPRPTSRRIASGASTVRGPATPPRDVDSPDVFSSPAAVAAPSMNDDAVMADVSRSSFAVAVEAPPG